MLGQAVLFDFDYTLVDSSEAIIYCFNALCEQLNVPLVDPKLIVKCIGMSLEDILMLFFPNIDETQMQAYKSIYLDYSKEHSAKLTKFFPDTISALTQLKVAGYKLGIVSTKFTPRIVEFLNQTHQENLFDIIIGGDLVKAYKPAPDGIYLASEKLNIKLENITFVGDSAFDFNAAQNASIPFKAVLNGTTTKDDFIALGCLESQIYSSLTNITQSLL